VVKPSTETQDSRRDGSVSAPRIVCAATPYCSISTAHSVGVWVFVPDARIPKFDQDESELEVETLNLSVGDSE
jgi:hypothetical protein